MAALFVLLIVAACGGTDTSEGALPPRAELRISAVALVPQGGRVRVTATVRNRGRAAAGPTLVAFIVSADRTRDASDRRVARVRIDKLGRGRSAQAVARLRVPSGRPWLFTCADARRRVRETSEANNCRRSRVAAPAGGTTPAADSTPPTFAGITSATTCLAGPHGSVKQSRHDLAWEPAADDQTPAAALVYDVYVSRTADGHDFGRPSYTTAAGARTFTTPELAADSTWHFVVRARDRAGNRDANRVVLEGKNICR